MGRDERVKELELALLRDDLEPLTRHDILEELTELLATEDDDGAER